MRILNIELLRALAAVMVLVAHVSEGILAYGGTGPAYRYLSLVGSSGVDLFFVISGFVITTSFWRNPRSSWAFLRARVRRVVPAYWILTTVAIVALLVAARVGLPTSLPRPTILSSVESYLFLNQSLSHNPPVLGQGWTLEYEMLFYTVFTLSIVAKKHIALIASVSLLALGLVLGYGWLVVEFIVGMGIAAFTFKQESSPPRAMAWAIVAFGILGLGLSDLWANPSDWRVLSWGVPAAAVVLGSVWLPQLNSRFVAVAGRISYPVYLIQWFVTPILCLIAAKLGVIGSLSVAVVIIDVIVTQGIAYTFDKFVDQPIKRTLLRVGF
jgi:exopolysaccharide production protein ExoZ